MHTTIRRRTAVSIITAGLAIALTACSSISPLEDVDTSPDVTAGENKPTEERSNDTGADSLHNILSAGDAYVDYLVSSPSKTGDPTTILSSFNRELVSIAGEETFDGNGTAEKIDMLPNDVKSELVSATEKYVNLAPVSNYSELTDSKKIAVNIATMMHKVGTWKEMGGKTLHAYINEKKVKSSTTSVFIPKEAIVVVDENGEEVNGAIDLSVTMVQNAAGEWKVDVSDVVKDS